MPRKCQWHDHCQTDEISITFSSMFLALGLETSSLASVHENMVVARLKANCSVGREHDRHMRRQTCKQLWKTGTSKILSWTSSKKLPFFSCESLIWLVYHPSCYSFARTLVELVHKTETPPMTVTDSEIWSIGSVSDDRAIRACDPADSRLLRVSFFYNGLASLLSWQVVLSLDIMRWSRHVYIL